MTEAVATQETPAVVAETPSEDGKTKKHSAPIQLTVPLDLKTQIENHVKSTGAPSSARWILELVAKEFDYTLAAPTRVATRGGGVKMTDVFAKDLTPAEKAERLSQAKLLLDGLAKGIVNLDDIKAKLGV